VAWKDALLAAGRAAKGIKDGHLTAIRSLYNYGVVNGLLALNPAHGVKVRYKRSAATRMLPCEDAEVAWLLALADNEDHAARRWLPWLLALSGARIGELAQLWGRRIVEIDGVVVMKLSPAEDGGSFKTEGSEREVPIHPAILQRGFLAFVQSRGDGPLFYRGSGANRGVPGKRQIGAQKHQGFRPRGSAAMRRGYPAYRECTIGTGRPIPTEAL
jgi:integrase